MIDWEGLKAKYAKATSGPWEVDHDGDRSLVYVSMPLANTPIADCWSNCQESDAELIAAIRNAFPAILAQHEQDQRIIAAAKKQIELLKTHPCLLEDGGFDHDWQFVDESFDHEFGTEIVHYYQCKHCTATKEAGGEDDE